MFSSGVLRWSSARWQFQVSIILWKCHTEKVTRGIIFSFWCDILVYVSLHDARCISAIASYYIEFREVLKNRPHILSQAVVKIVSLYPKWWFWNYNVYPLFHKLISFLSWIRINNEILNSHSSLYYFSASFVALISNEI